MVGPSDLRDVLEGTEASFEPGGTRSECNFSGIAETAAGSFAVPVCSAWW